MDFHSSVRDELLIFTSPIGIQNPLNQGKLVHFFFFRLYGKVLYQATEEWVM